MTSTQAALCILVHKDRGRLVAGIRQADAGANCETQHQVIVGFSQGDASSRAGCRHYDLHHSSMKSKTANHPVTGARNNE